MGIVSTAPYAACFDILLCDRSGAREVLVKKLVPRVLAVMILNFINFG